MKKIIKILLVDDSPTKIMELQSMLEEENYSVETAVDGLKAIDFLNNCSDLPDVILSDIFMPNMNGFELCIETRKAYPNIPFIILTAHNDEKNLQKAFNVGAVDYLGLPFTKTELIMRLSNVLLTHDTEKKLADKVSLLSHNQLELENQNKELHRAQLESEKINRSFKTLFYHASDALLVIYHNKFIDCNKSTIKILNAKSKKDIFKTHPSELSPEKQPDGRNSFEKANEMIEIAFKKGFHRFEWMHKKLTGELFLVEVSLTAIEYNNKLMLHTLWKDITEQKRIQKALVKSEAQLQGLLDNSPDMISHIGLDNKISWANKTVLDSFPDAIGKMCLFSDSDTPCDGCPIARVLKTGKLEKGLVTIHNTGNLSEKQFWDTIGVPLKDSEGKTTGVLKISRNTTERTKMENKIKEANKELEKLAFTDTLTGLTNRKPFVDLLDNNISRAKRENQKLALLFLDLENFKIINDIYGHKIGDELLITAAEILKKMIRKSDFVGRFGGDEFVLCLNDIDSVSDATHISQKINDAFSKKIKIKEQILTLGISIGIAIYPNDGENSNDLIKNSDLAMYKAKTHKKNSYHLYNIKLQKELLIEQASREALEKNEFIINFQHIVDKNENTFCVEALLRWESPEFGTIMPNDFIPILEKHRSIIEVGDWVFKEICKKIVEFKKNNQQINISVNMSQFQIEDELFVDRIENIIKETKVNPQNILIEITEKFQSKNTEKIKSTLAELKKIGIGFIALDDFGTGYSSFSNLILYPIDVVKIDKFFIDRLGTEKYSNITSALISLIQKYNLQIIAEGVETKEQFEQLRDMGCDYFQGYYFSKPQKNILK